MKIFTTKLSTLALCAFVMGSSVFAGGKTTVHLNVPNNSQTSYFKNKDGRYVTESENNIDIAMDPSSINNATIYKTSQYSLITEIKKSRPNTDFKGYAAWNWIFDKDYNETRQGLDSDGKTVLCEEKNGVVTSSKVKTYGANTCARG
ncbi:hypothetical protein [Candidatus Chromulinivorax destructor]|uniref:Uncharacterized protein n=1 Tax=Candidatus Chromulinivorax destructor TaxID=2066483 RepID=A0A345ZCT7_9BACT|nr:hypothetical protein [Candidatus Chromulinivorax destructor]AXK61104.1 hypothetical protein C0J27_05225 [Candidatus Chromulinivorax destructor]